ncbi:DUF418 domain-containing protein [Serinibacter arcticus]|uniref:10 TMS hypothetical membrane protein n=1 Tax=Serinibacter arcticus TaxID=1655435 RepID=A0A4Z1E2A9_9MICO|nr:DUF418 domain-containing protein [Serinibacter arcticus]TGO05400.1 10 TMS hypothetical membrane protein [Serinibacter arcticus]
MTSAQISPRTTAEPTSLTTRSLAPDLARGAMLLLIALANIPWYLWGAEQRDLSQHPVDGSTLDRAVQTVMLIAVDARSYPMFAALFGYGIWQLYSRQAAAGTPHREARALLRRRHWWMVAFGGVHALLLWAGDIVGAYGLVGLVLVALFIDRADRTLRTWAIVLTSVLLAAGVLALISAALLAAAGADLGASGQVGVDTGVAEPSYLASVLDRVVTWAVGAPAQAFLTGTIPTAVLVGILAARHRLLEEPERHLPLLRRTAVVGIAVGWLGGAVTAAQHLDLWGIPAALDWGFLFLQTSTGLLGGLGYVALFGLLAARLRRRERGPGRVAWALQAVGKRSLTSYLAQSVLMAPLLAAWGFGLGAELSSATAALVAVGVWLLTVGLACWLESAGRRGPAERALRRLAYRR